MTMKNPLSKLPSPNCAAETLVLVANAPVAPVVTKVTVSPETRQALDDYATTAPYGDRHHLIRLVMHTPDLHMA